MSRPDPIGSVVELWRYPVKSMAGESVRASGVGPRGLWGDRGWAVRDDAERRTGTAKRLPALLRFQARYANEPEGDEAPEAWIDPPDGPRFASGSPEAAERLSAALRRPATFWRLETSKPPDYPSKALRRAPPLPAYFDDAAVHLITTASLSAMRRRRPGSDFDRRRFRPNIVVEAAEAPEGFPEEAWRGRALGIGTAVLRVLSAVARCVMTTLETGELGRDPAILEAVARERANRLGAYLSVERPGRLAVGDEVRLA